MSKNKQNNPAGNKNAGLSIVESHVSKEESVENTLTPTEVNVEVQDKAQPEVKTTETPKVDLTPIASQEPTSSTTIVSNKTEETVKQDGSHPVNLPGQFYKQYDQLKGRSLSRINTILDYLEEMKPGKPIDPVKGGRLQVTLFKTIQAMINTEPLDFEKVFALFLGLYEVFSKENGAFHPRYINRFHEVMNLDAEERRAFSLWHAAFLKLANPNGRQQAVKMIDLNKVFHEGLDEGGIQRITSFFVL